LKLYFASKFLSLEVFKRIAAGSDALQIPVQRGPIRLDSPRFVSFANSAGLELHYWTINEPKEMLRLASIGASGIVSDRCDVAKATLRQS
jgi:glycerophosphoryl diester phosphodiesterase